jgi:hypothetical protein
MKAFIKWLEGIARGMNWDKHMVVAVVEMRARHMDWWLADGKN